MSGITVFDYGAGNLHSVVRALGTTGLPVEVVTDLGALKPDRLLVLPGVGAFAPAAERLRPFRAELVAAVRDGMPVLGICLGMQLLFDRSEEGDGQGLGLIRGAVRRLRTERSPHMGWNQLEGGALGWAYFAHSFVCEPEEPVVVASWTEHCGVRFAASVRRERILGVQYHPEKSGAAGVQFLKAAVGELLS